MKNHHSSSFELTLPRSHDLVRAAGGKAAPMVEILRIDDPADPRLAPFRDIRERDLTRRGQFIAEGAVVLDQIAASTGFVPLSLLVLESRLAGLSTRLAALPRSLPVHVASETVMDAVAGFHVHRGVLALAGRRTEGREVGPLLASAARAGGLVVAAIGLSNHDNLGSLFRNAAAFGVKAVLLDETSCDPLYRKAIRVSVGTVLTVPFHRFASAGDLLGALDGAGFRCFALSPQGRLPLGALRRRGPAALLLGAEGPGLPPSLMARVETVSIEMAPGLDSLNVATSAAIALHHLFVAERAP